MPLAPAVKDFSVKRRGYRTSHPPLPGRGEREKNSVQELGSDPVPW